MVRKRTRTARKNYESDENDSDSDFSLEDIKSQPAPKKYSLRQRKKALFIDDYDYEDDDEILPIPPTNKVSDDEDFEVERELAAATSEFHGNIDNSEYSNHYEEENPTEDPNGLIDFEDMIRADIVVNKNRIDYDNMINKTEIKMNPTTDAPVTPMKSKRGRKPKKRPENEVDSSLLEPSTEVQETYDDKNDKDYYPEEENNVRSKEQIDSDREVGCQEDVLNFVACPEFEETENNVPDTTDNVDSSTQESVIKFNESYLHKADHTNGEVSSTETHNSKTNSLEEYEDGDDDDVVFVEDKRPEIIVLDD